MKAESTPKICILAGGRGTRLVEESDTKPKPMVEVGGRPIIWHIMKLFAHHGFCDFLVAVGYKGSQIADYFAELREEQLREEQLREGGKVWQVRCEDTGESTATGGRVKQICKIIDSGIFLMTYGDGVADVDIPRLLAFHRAHGKLATVTAVIPPARFGAITFDGDRVAAFQEKPSGSDGWINGGFFVLDVRVAEYIESDDTPFEREPLTRLAESGELVGFRHTRFWQCVDTRRDLQVLEDLWSKGVAPWAIWKAQEKEREDNL